AILEIAEHAQTGILRFHVLCKERAERSVHRPARFPFARKQERGISDADLGHLVGQRTRREIAERGPSLRDQAMDVGWPQALVHLVPEIVVGDPCAAPRGQSIADRLPAGTEMRGRRSVAAESHANRLGHVVVLPVPPRRRSGASFAMPPATASPMRMQARWAVGNPNATTSTRAAVAAILKGGCVPVHLKPARSRVAAGSLRSWHGHHFTAPLARSAAISSGASLSSSPSTWSVCSPSLGAGLEMVPSMPDILIGLPGSLTRPTSGWSYSTIISRSAT